MRCEICQEPNAYTVKFVIENGQSVCLGCDRCLGIAPMVHDVYFRHPYKSEALDVEFTSKAQKAKYLKEHQISEAGDQSMSEIPWIEGTRSYRKAQFEKERPMIQELQRRYRASHKR